MQLAEMIYQAGIIGCGGAGFPTHAKYGSRVETIIINGAECEPLLQTDCFIMRNHADELIKAADMLLQETRAATCVIALKHSYKRELEALEQAISSRNSSVGIYQLDGFFPAGDEQTIVYEVTKKIVPPAGIPLDVGCVVSNIATLYCISEAMEGKVFAQKYVTVTGEVENPIIARVPIGTPVNTCLELAGDPMIEDYVVINGGPMMGKLMTREEAGEACITKTMSGLIVLPADSDMVHRLRAPWESMINRAKSVCIQCSFCTQLCPRALLGHPLEPHRIMRKLASGQDINELMTDRDIQNVALCCSCGVCEIYACPMGLQPRTINTMLKKELSKAGFRYQRPEGEWQASSKRSLRKVPTERIAARAGVAAYEKIIIDEEKEILPEEIMEVHLNLQQGIGAPAVPMVECGELVKKGQMIATCPSGKIGSNLHASIDGVVVAVERWITIRRSE